MTAKAVKGMSTLHQLPLISNGKLVACREPLPYTTDLSTSLPPLPGYTVHGDVRSRWGEDEDICRLGYGAASGGYSRYRNNFDSCHPVSEDPEQFKYEGYMYPKPMHQDLTVLRNSASNTSRRVPRDSKCELFPRHVSSRLYDGGHILGGATRTAIEENITRLYRTAHYNTIFKDITPFMLAKAQRDVQYRLHKGHDYIDTSTCSRIHNHPNPCHQCWYGGCNKGFEAKVAEFQSKLHSSVNLTHAENSCGGCGETESPSVQHVTCNVCCGIKANMETLLNPEQTTENDQANEQCNVSGQIDDIMFEDTFGPWQDTAKNRSSGDEQIIVSNVYQLKIPPSIHCRSTRNYYVEPHTNELDHKQMSHDQWKSLYRGNNVKELHTVPNKDNEQTTITRFQPKAKQTTRNSWTYRNENNLRIPCIADVIGSSSKSDAHKRTQSMDSNSTIYETMVNSFTAELNETYPVHHKVSINEAHFSKVHLGIPQDIFIELFTTYIKNRTDLNVDFSITHTGDPYGDMWDNLPDNHYLVDMECALRDFLEVKKCLYVQYKDISKVRTELKLGFSCWLYMLRRYINRYHPNIELEWCEHSLQPNSFCECNINTEPRIDGLKDDKIFVNVLTLFCDHHANRNW